MTEPFVSLRSDRPVTAKDVAELAGVARPTVSMVLNGAKSNTNVAEATRRRIFEAAQELGYRPNLAARAMKSGKSRQVGVLVRNNSRLEAAERGAHPLAYDMVLGISEGLEEAGYMMNFVRLSDVDPAKHTQASAFQGHILDGLIIISDVPAAKTAHLEKLVPRCIWLDSTSWRENNCIRRDELHAGELTGQEVALLGYREWIVVDTYQPHATNSHYAGPLRRAGLQSVAQKVGANMRSFAVTDAQNPFGALASQLSPHVAVIALGAYTAHKLLYALLDHGMRPGHDFGLACCEEASGPLAYESLARASFDRFALGQQAARMMIERLDDPDAQSTSQLIRGHWLPGKTLPLLK